MKWQRNGEWPKQTENETKRKGKKRNTILREQQRRTTEAMALCCDNEKRFDKLKRQYTEYALSPATNTPNISNRHQPKPPLPPPPPPRRNVWIYICTYICLRWSERKQRRSHMFYVYNLEELKWKSESEKLNDVKKCVDIAPMSIRRYDAGLIDSVPYVHKQRINRRRFGAHECVCVNYSVNTVNAIPPLRQRPSSTHREVQHVYHYSVSVYTLREHYSHTRHTSVPEVRPQLPPAPSLSLVLTSFMRFYDFIFSDRFYLLPVWCAAPRLTVGSTRIWAIRFYDGFAQAYSSNAKIMWQNWIFSMENHIIRCNKKKKINIRNNIGIRGAHCWASWFNTHHSCLPPILGYVFFSQLGNVYSSTWENWPQPKYVCVIWIAECVRARENWVKHHVEMTEEKTRIVCGQRWRRRCASYIFRSVCLFRTCNISRCDKKFTATQIEMRDTAAAVGSWFVRCDMDAANDDWCYEQGYMFSCKERNNFLVFVIKKYLLHAPKRLGSSLTLLLSYRVLLQLKIKNMRQFFRGHEFCSAINFARNAAKRTTSSTKEAHFLRSSAGLLGASRTAIIFHFYYSLAVYACTSC